MSGNSVPGPLKPFSNSPLLSNGIQSPIGTWANKTWGANTFAAQTANFLFNPGSTMDPIKQLGNNAMDSMTSNGPGTPEAAGPPPSTNQAMMDSLHAQLQQELQMRRQRTLFTGPGGLSNTGNVASTVLLGA